MGFLSPMWLFLLKFCTCGSTRALINIMWSLVYFVSGVGIDEEAIKHDVEFQGRQDEGQLRQELYAGKRRCSYRTPVFTLRAQELGVSMD
ncbi:MAG: hypothetical protein BMS9Abin11_1146 [Gammaproteobacteria bacterium]|nr:MAG: hypothetical protein BMS9Abin11_1146 [Gammaproteobacteria bacterium]